jgi:large subunit ribosomal protein L29
MKTAKELQSLTPDELSELLFEKQEALRKMRFGTAGSGLRNTASLRTLRREIARILTIQTQRRHAGITMA